MTAAKVRGRLVRRRCGISLRALEFPPASEDFRNITHQPLGKAYHLNGAATNGLEYLKGSYPLSLILEFNEVPLGLAVDQGGFLGGPHP